MKLAFVVQRSGGAISGGAELHCRWVAEHMSPHRGQCLRSNAGLLYDDYGEFLEVLALIRRPGGE
jgi:hypothetical protein